MARSITTTARNLLTSLGLVSVLVLAGCGDDGGEGGQDEPTTTPGTETSAVAGEYVPASADGPAQNVPVPELPEAAQEQTIEGAEATLEYWWEALEYVYLTGDPKPLQDASASDCETCRFHIQNWPAVYEDNHWLVFKLPLSEQSNESVTYQSDTSFQIQYESSEPEVVIYAPTGTPVEDGTTDAETITVESRVDFDSQEGRWKVYEMRAVNDS